MALFTFVLTGDFEADSTWDVGSGFPGATDTFIIDIPGTVTVSTVLAAATSGQIGGTDVSNVGKLTIADGGKLTLNADLTLNNWNHLQIDGGGELDIDGNDVITTSNTPGAHILDIVGTAINRAKVSSSTVGVGDFKRSTGGGMASLITVNFNDFSGCGKIKLGDNIFEGHKLDIRNTVFVGCDEPFLGGFQHGNNDYILSGIDIRDDRSTTANVGIIERTDGLAATGTGTQLIEKITAVANTASVFRWNVKGINRSKIVTDRIVHSSVTGRGYTVLDSFFRLKSTSAAILDNARFDILQDSYVFADGDNPHGVGAAENLVNGVIEATYTVAFTDNGDHYILNTSFDETATGVLILEEKSGVFFNALSAAMASNYVMNHCTMVGNYNATYGSIARTEAGGSYTGTFSVQSNLTVSNLASARGFNLLTGGDDQVTLMDFNAWVDVTDQYSGVTSATKTPGVTVGYGGNDFNGIDPNFVDSTRNLAKWAGTVTASATADSAVEHLLKINGYNETSKTQVPDDIISEVPKDATDYVRAGYAPTNILYQGTAHDGGDVGAIAVVAAGGDIINNRISIGIGIGI